MTRGKVMLSLSAMLLALSGCVERRFVIETNQPGALVYQNGRPLGATPVDGHFDYYGVYRFTIVKDGYQTKQVDQRIAAPWFAYPPLDFFVENLYPGYIRDIRRFQYDLDPLPQPQINELIIEGEELRSRGQALPEPSVPSLRKEPAPQPQPPPPVIVPPVAPARQQPIGDGPQLGEPVPIRQPNTIIGSSANPSPNRLSSTPRPNP